MVGFTNPTVPRQLLNDGILLYTSVAQSREIPRGSSGP
jgi:hypothetical protein